MHPIVSALALYAGARRDDHPDPAATRASGNSLAGHSAKCPAQGAALCRNPGEYSRRGGDAARNAQIAREILGGARSVMSDLIALNAGCVLYIAEQAATIADGIANATASLKSGQGAHLLGQVVAHSQQLR